MAEHKISTIVGAHCSDAAVYTMLFDWRDPPSWQRRVQEWVDATNTFGAEAAINVGDTVEARTTDSLKLSFLSGSPSFLSVVTHTDTGLTCPRADAGGNHIFGTDAMDDETPIWNGSGDLPPISDYFAVIGNQTSGQSLTKENLDGPNGKPYSYTFDESNITYICLHIPYGWPYILTQNQLDWLTARLAAAALPVVIFAHAHCWQDPNHTLGTPWYAYQYTDLYDIFDACELVQLVLGGHRHTHAYHYKRNDIHYLSFGGSVGIRQESDAGLKNNYAMITLDTQVIPTPYGMKANLQVEGVGTWAKSCSRVYDTYGVM